MQERFSDSREAVSTLWAMTYFLEMKDWYLYFAGGPLKKMPRNLTRDVSETIEIQRRVFKTKTGEGFFQIENRGCKMKNRERFRVKEMAFVK